MGDIGDMNWFSVEGIKAEIGRIRWPKGEEFKSSIVDVFSFTIAMGVFYVACEYIVALFIKTIGA